MIRRLCSLAGHKVVWRQYTAVRPSETLTLYIGLCACGEKAENALRWTPTEQVRFRQPEARWLN